MFNQPRQVRNARSIWSAVGRAGFVSLQELDPILAQQLAGLATKPLSLALGRFVLFLLLFCCLFFVSLCM